MGIFDKLFKTQDDGCGAELIIEDVFEIAGRGVVVVGRVKDGMFRRTDKVIVITDNGELSTRITAIEVRRIQCDLAKKGDDVGLLLNGLSREQVHKFDVVRKC